MSRNHRARLVVILLAGFGLWCAFHSWARSQSGAVRSDAGSPKETLERRFETQLKPFLQRYCFACHRSKKPEASLDLSRDASVGAVVKNFRKWETVLERLHAQEMPPKDASQPTATERAVAVSWLTELRDREANLHAGDPGIVPVRRLSNAEFDYTIRDLTGIDIRPTREFPVDPANEAGFDNSGEALAMSPALLSKYLGAARLIADHALADTQRPGVRAVSRCHRHRPR